MRTTAKILFLLLITIPTLNNVLGQYLPKSAHLQNTNKLIEYVDSCARFWTKSFDYNTEGFYTNVARNGSVINSSVKYKNMITQSRTAYGMVRAFMLTGNKEYLNLAQRALEFMYKNAWDKNNGGWFNSLNSSGTPTNLNERKTAFDQHYALLGISAFYEATYDSSAWDWLIKGYESNENNLWDNRNVFYGYYDNADVNWKNKNGKSFNATVDAITTHLVYLYLITGDDVYKNRLLQVGDNMLDRLTASMDSQKIGFVEEYDSDWNYNENETMTIMGHVLKTSWSFARLYNLFNDAKYKEAAEKLTRHVLEKGYDHKYGGPYKDYNRKTGAMLMWGQDTAKAWWQMEQAITAGFMLYDITKNEDYLKMADETLDFFMKYFVDNVYGEVYSDRFKDGRAIPAWGDQKGNGSKAAYHSIELGYYSYLYGNLFYHKNSVSLFYDFEPTNEEREIQLYPLAVDGGKLFIKEVELEGEAYSSFSGTERKLFIPENVGGVFKVTFEMNLNSDVKDQLDENLNQHFILSQNYPNPFNPTTNINFYSPNDEHVKLRVFDLLGRLVAELYNGNAKAGLNSVVFNAENLSSGIYFYVLEGEDFRLSNKMILMK